MSPEFRPLDAALKRELAELVGAAAVVDDPVDLDRYASDWTEGLRFPPEAAVRPADPAAVARLLGWASDRRVPITARSGGTGLTGGALPVRGGLVVSLERLDRIRDIDPRDAVAEVEPGVVTARLHAAVEEVGLLYPPDPSSKDTCQLGGNLAEDAAGPRSLRYGTTRQHVLGLEVALANGTLLRTGGRTRKDVAGYNLTQLFLGSEGTLGIITAATVKLWPRPAASLSLLLPFTELDRAAAAVEALCRHSRALAACELVERIGIHEVAAIQEVPAWLLEQEAVLLLELLGDRADDLLDAAAEIGEIAEPLGAGEIQAAQDLQDQHRLWTVRRRVGEAVMEHRRYREIDAAVPRSRLAELVRAARRAADRHGLEALCFGHAGDGNLHVNILEPRAGIDDWPRCRDAAERELLDEVIALGGTITAEHGVGWTMRRHFERFADPELKRLMKGLKALFDPAGILNPGKLFLEGDPVAER